MFVILWFFLILLMLGYKTDLENMETNFYFQTKKKKKLALNVLRQPKRRLKGSTKAV